MRSTRSFLAVALVACAIPYPGLAAAEAGTEASGFEVSHDCGDSVDLPWRCVVVRAEELAPALTLFEGACFLVDTLVVVPWASTVKDGVQQAAYFVISGRQLDRPCDPDTDAVEALAALGLEPPAAGSAW